ncbi:MAG: choice-of-anchor L domain-containing protein [Ferruginibacter sp.]
MKFILSLLGVLLFAGICNAQLQITTQNNGQLLAQRLVGDGITISNVTLSADSISTGFFRNISGTQIGIDSGIVLTTGRAKTESTANFEIGLDGDGVTQANDLSDLAFANNQVNYNAHDADLEQLIGITANSSHDATVLEFDFIPDGDSIKFRYVFSSEEYPVFACPSGGGTLFNDAFAFFIQGPGFPTKTNIALVPNTNDPVSIHNINDQGCAPYPALYIDNETNVNFTHNGHTRILTAKARVEPCQTYHLKLVIADVQDDAYDSGVFLDARSLTSNIVRLTNNTQVDNLNNSYIVEGCITGSFTVKRPTVTSSPLGVAVTYGGTAINGVDVQPLPTLITIPANDSVVTVNVIPIIDNMPEGIETIKIYASTGCSSVITDSAVIQIRDYDTLSITPADNATICKGGSIQLVANAAWSTFLWDAVPGLSDYTVADPIATPTQNGVNYICTSTVGTCNGRDSVYVEWKQLEFDNQTDINCHNGSTGQIVVSGGPEWTSPPVLYSINDLPPQASGTFGNLPTGSYMVHISDASGCVDSLPVNLIQAYPDLLITNTTSAAGKCSTDSLGSVTVTVTGGLSAYQYSIDGINFQPGNVFNLHSNTYTITVNDVNNCTTSLPGVVIPFVNDLSITAGPDTTVCAGQSVKLIANSTADTYSWSPTTGLTSPNSQTTFAAPDDNTIYTVTGILNGCTQTATVEVKVGKNLSVDAGGPLYIDAGGNVHAAPVVSGSNTNLASILWTGAEGLSDTNILDPVITPPGVNGESVYTITVTNTSGCSASDELIVKIVPVCIKVRNAFTPNGDGINDRWLVYDDFSCLQNVKVQVFNRYGSKVFESNDYRNTWEGRFGSKTLPDGTYYAIIEFTMLSGKTRTVKTDVTILR